MANRNNELDVLKAKSFVDRSNIKTDNFKTNAALQLASQRNSDVTGMNNLTSLRL